MMAITYSSAAASRAELMGFYRDMLLIRRFEERAGQLYGMGLIGGFCHLYIGQEAVVVGMQAARPRPYARLRHGSQGDHGRAHWPHRRLLQGQGRLDAHVQPGESVLRRPRHRRRAGLARHRHRLRQQVFNMASLWRLPIVYIIENNQYAMGTSVQRSSSETQLHKRGQSFNIPGEEVDGMDVAAVREAGRRAVERARNGRGPILLEMKTYRYRGHSMSDPAKYRTREEVDAVRSERDPIEHVKALLTQAGHVSDEELKEIDREIRAVVQEAAAFAQESPEPPASELMTDIVLEAQA
jgi:pyruvate dehydrogenase E1 component alpha subunit